MVGLMPVDCINHIVITDAWFHNTWLLYIFWIASPYMIQQCTWCISPPLVGSCICKVCWYLFMTLFNLSLRLPYNIALSWKVVLSCTCLGKKESRKCLLYSAGAFLAEKWTFWLQFRQSKNLRSIVVKHMWVAIWSNLSPIWQYNTYIVTESQRPNVIVI